MLSVKDLDQVAFKATYPIEIAGVFYNTGDIFFILEKVQLSTMSEDLSIKTANGGKGNLEWVYWETKKGIQYTFSKGILSPITLAFMMNSNLTEEKEKTLSLFEKEKLILDKDGENFLKRENIERIHRVIRENGEISSNYILEGKKISIPNAENEKIEVYYDFLYKEKFLNFKMGENLLNGYIGVQARTTFYDEEEKRKRTGIFTIPKMRLVSNLNIHLGETTSPILSTIVGEGVSQGRMEPISTLHLLDESIY